jgi:predicted LPLAT superfamily acyltransferase
MEKVTDQPGAKPWHARREWGQGAGIWLVERVARLAGRRAAHLFLAPVTAYYLLTRPAERRASREFLTRMLGRPVGIRDGFRHFYTFARVNVDRVFLLSPHGHRIPMRVTGQQKMEATLRQGRGCILLSAHFGSFEAARQCGLNNPALRLRVLLDRDVNRRLIDVFERTDPGFAANIIDAAGEPLALSLRIGECLRAGEWVGWLGDRHRGDERTVTVEFLGGQARFPASPFIIARLFKVPVFLVLAAFDGVGYQVHVEDLVDDAGLTDSDRDSFVKERAALFADRLAHHVRSAPWNWFNFYDFWDA